MQLMGEKTGAFTATLSSEPDAIAPANLQQYDAVYLNNTVGDIFDTPEMRAAFAAFVANGGGVVGNHGTSVASPQWTEFGDILGATGASHREPTEIGHHQYRRSRPSDHTRVRRQALRIHR